MASDAQESQKHRRSPSSSDDADKSLKRHKHRHDHRRHRHGSRKQGDESKPIADETDASSPPPLATRPHEDVEEGEILDDDAFDGISANNTPQYDAHSATVLDQSHNPDLGLGNVNSYPEDKGENNTNSKTLEKYAGDKNLVCKLADKAGKATQREASSPTNLAFDTEDDMVSRVSLARNSNGFSNYQSGIKDKIRKKESVSPSRRSDEKNSYYDDGKLDGGRSKLGNRIKLSSQSTGDKYKTVVHLPSQDDDKVRDRSRSRSYDRANERSRLRGAMEEEDFSKRRRYLADRNKVDRDFEGCRTIRGHDYGDLHRDEERECGVVYSSRYGVDDRHNSKEARTREGSREREADADREREKERAKRDREIDRDRRRGRERERSRDWDLDRERRREGETYRSRDREVGRDRKREKERDRSRDKGSTIDRSRDSERERDRDRDRYSDRTMERQLEKRDDGYRDKGRDRDRDKHENLEDIHDGQDRYRRSRNSGHDERDYSKDEMKKTDPRAFQTSKVDNDLVKRDEDEKEDHEETATLQLAEQEEEDLNRIKEESRRRRQAILEKHKNKQLQQQTGTDAHSEDAEKGLPGQSAAPSSSLQGLVDCKPGGVDIFVVETPSPNAVAEPSGIVGAGGLGEGTPKSERADGMFCDDIFGETPTGIRKYGKGYDVRIERSALHDNWDDAEGYYSYRFGELLDGRYEITAAHGKGVFSTVVRARNIKASIGEPEEVAIKIIRSNDTMYKAGMTELVILKKLVGQDPENKRHCVRFLSSFKYRNHLCLVFESLHMNLREVLKRFGRNIGLKLTAVRAYAKQLFIALKHLKNCGVLHCDIKPDNMLVNEAKNVLKLCDFGNAMFAGKNEITPYLVSRFYRAPEIILGLPYDHPLDIWSVGCCLYELYTGKVLFPGATNNDMLRFHMELKGPFPKKMLRKGAFTDKSFDQDLNFHATEEDPVTRKAIKRLIPIIKPKDIGSIIVGSPGEDPKMLADFKDLLDKMFVLDPDKRLTVSQALSHPFITGK